MIDPWLDPNDSFSNIINNDGVFQNKQQFYFYFSWAGLEGTQEYQNLNSSEKTMIQYAIQLIQSH